MLIGNNVAEKDIREHLSANGYFGRTATFVEIELHAIQRPGWLQVFRFQVNAKSTDDHWVKLFGAMRDDERFKKTEILFFSNNNKRDQVLKSWSKGLMQPKFRNGKHQEFSRAEYFSELLIFVLILTILIAILAFLGIR